MFLWKTDYEYTVQYSKMKRFVTKMDISLKSNMYIIIFFSQYSEICDLTAMDLSIALTKYHIVWYLNSSRNVGHKTRRLSYLNVIIPVLAKFYTFANSGSCYSKHWKDLYTQCVILYVRVLYCRVNSKTLNFRSQWKSFIHNNYWPCILYHVLSHFIHILIA